MQYISKDEGIQMVRQTMIRALTGQPLPVGIVYQDSQMLVVDALPGEKGLTVSMQPVSAKPARHIEDIHLYDLAALVESGIRGPGLSNAMKLASATRTEVHNRYETLLKDMDEAMARSDFDGQWELIESFDRKAKEEGSLVGRVIKEPVADGYAYYAIVETRSEKVRVMSIPYMDAYVHRHWESDAWVDKTYAMRLVQAEDALEHMMNAQGRDLQSESGQEPPFRPSENFGDFDPYDLGHSA